MKRFFLLIAIFTFFATSAQVKNDTTGAYRNLKVSADSMTQFFLKKNYNEYVKFIHPDLIKLVGSKEKMILSVKVVLESLDDQGLSINNITVGDSLKILNAGAELQSVVPEILELKAKKGKFISTSYLIAISKNKGKTWYFIDTSNKTLAEMKKFFPSLSNKLVLPEKTKPEFIPD